jgi:hypothetical protein
MLVLLQIPLNKNFLLLRISPESRNIANAKAFLHWLEEK